MIRNTILFACAMATALLLSSCGSKNEKEVDITIVGADGSEYESYQECCTAADFVAAHRYIDRMESQGHSTYEARDYVFREEALYLMSLGDDNAKKRIVYLLKQDDSSSHDGHCDMLMELAIDADDEAFVKTLARHYNDPISSDILRKIVEYLYIEKGDDSNLDFVTTLLNRYDQGDLLLDAAVEKGDEALVVSLAKQFSGIVSISTFKVVINFLLTSKSKDYEPILQLLMQKIADDEKEDLFNYAIDNGDEALVVQLAKRYNGTISFSTYRDISDFLRLRNNPQYVSISNLLASKTRDKLELLNYAISKQDTKLIMELAPEYGNINDQTFVTSMIASQKPEMANVIIKMLNNYKMPGKVPTPYVDYKGNTPDYQAVKEYLNGIEIFNGICSQVLDIAITHGNKQVAQRVLLLLKKRPGFWDFPPGSLGDKEGRITINDNVYDDAIKEAKKKYQDAVRSGAFK